jgi:hypothetical protein
MKLVSLLRDQEVRLGFLLDDNILEPCLARSSLAPGEEQMFRDATSLYETIAAWLAEQAKGNGASIKLMSP